MAFVGFPEWFPKVAERETRCITVTPEANDDLPPGQYVFLEMYCDEVGCDCRRVFFYVLDANTRDVAAVIAWGWEDEEFYRKWSKNLDESFAPLLKGPVLNDGSRQSRLAPALLKLVREVLLEDPDYIERIKRHYSMFRRKVDRKEAMVKQQRSFKRRRKARR